jgi:tRNA dimethylallyltransferase
MPDSEPLSSLVAIVGPTATGKTALALALAAEFNAEIISADSRQVYRDLDIGTAKPTAAQRAQAAHHVLDVVPADSTSFSVAVWREHAEQALAKITARGKRPWLVGGTGFYVQSIVDGLKLPAVPPQPQLRAELEQTLEFEGIAALGARLQELDPAAAAQIDLRNPRRLMRALEVCIVTGQPFSAQRQKSPPSYPILQIGLRTERETLYKRIDVRVDRMIEEGFVAEVARLLAAGLTTDLPSMQSAGYRQLAAHLQGSCTLDEAVQQTKYATHQLAKRQETWFRKQKGIQWIEVGPDSKNDARARIESFHEAGKG